MGKGNKSITISDNIEISDNQVIMTLPCIEIDGNKYHLLEVIQVNQCSGCGAKLYVNKSDYQRKIITSFGTFGIPIRYMVCSKCKHTTHDIIVGVGEGKSGKKDKNYAEEYEAKMLRSRYETNDSKHKATDTAEIYVNNTIVKSREPSASKVHAVEEEKGDIAENELRGLEINFDGTVYMDGYFIKTEHKKLIEEIKGRKLTLHEWKVLRNKEVLVAATSDKVVID